MFNTTFGASLMKINTHIPSQIFQPEGFMRVILFAVISTILCVQSSQAAERNIIVFVTDDESPTLGCYGDRVAVTPTIDSMAADGVVFDNAFATTASCSASRSVILSHYIITPMVSMGTSMTSISLQVGMTLSACHFLEH